MGTLVNKRYAAAMDHLEHTDPTAHKAIRIKVETLKAEAATWRRKAQASPPHGETPKKPLTDTHGEQSQRHLTPGTRVRDTGRPSRVGTIVNDPSIIDHPGMIPVVWDGSWRTFTPPETLTPIKVSGPITNNDPFK